MVHDDYGINCTQHKHIRLSYVTSTIIAVLCPLTISLNFFIMFALWKTKKQFKHKVFFYLLLNIAVSDIFSGIFANPVALLFHVKEILGYPIRNYEKSLLNITVFFFNTISILTISMISIDRVLALLKPFVYRKGLTKWKAVSLFIFCWIISALLTSPSLKIGYLGYLNIYSYTTVTFTAVNLLIVVVVYKRRFRVGPIVPSYPSTPLPNRNRKTGNTKSNLNINPKDVNASHLQNIRKEKENGVNNTFCLLLFSFLIIYLPVGVMSAYINLCKTCDCEEVYFIRNYTHMCILLSASCRPLSFILRLKTLKDFTTKLVKRECSQPVATYSHTLTLPTWILLFNFFL